jgi:hypothetical protein
VLVWVLYPTSPGNQPDAYVLAGQMLQSRLGCL